MLLYGANQKLQILLSGAVTTTELPYYVTLADRNGTSVSYPAPVHGTTNGATAVDAVAAPGGSVTRKVRGFFLWNADSAAAVVTLRVNDGGTTRVLNKFTLYPGESLQYVEQGGFSVMDSEGSLRASGLGGRYSGFPHLGHANGSGVNSRYYCGQSNATAATTLVVTANRLFALPFIAPPRNSRVSIVGIGVTTLAAGNVRVGVYGNKGPNNIYPDALLYDTGALSTGTTGIKSNAPDLDLVPGELYWGACVFDAAPTVRALGVAALMPILGQDSALSNAPQVGYQATFTYAALPDPFPAASALLTSTSPGIFVGYSS